MRRTPTDIVVESLRIDRCDRDDDVVIPCGPKGSPRAYGRVLLAKVKPIAGGMVQIKFRTTSLGSTVRKADLPADLVVERTRRATGADAPDAGAPERAEAVHRGVVYESTDPSVDAAQLAARVASLATARADRLVPAPRTIDAGILGGLDLGRVAMIAALSVGAGPTAVAALRDAFAEDRP